jgi:hypothetical protein
MLSNYISEKDSKKNAKYIYKMSELNVVDLIENNPITKLSKTYNSKLINKMQTHFTETEQQFFVSSFYCYLNYDTTLDFVVDLDNVWKWLGFKQKVDAKRLVEKHFKLNIDYKNIEPYISKKSFNQKTALVAPKAVLKQNGGQNIKKLSLNIKCFKALYLKAQTKKADEIHEYYMKMEEILHKTLEEETDELKLQLEEKDIMLQEKDSKLQESENKIQEKEKIINNSKKEKDKAIEKTLISQFPVNTECIYFGTIDNTNDKNERLIKFGHTNNLGVRIQDHHKIYDNFILKEAFKVQNKVEIENLIKTYPRIKKHIRTIEVAGKNKTEIIAYDLTNFTIPRLSQYIKTIIQSKTYSIENFNNLLKRNEELENESRDMNETINKLKYENHTLAQKIQEHEETIEKQKKSLDLYSQEQNYDEWVKSGDKEPTNEAVVDMENINKIYKNPLIPNDELTDKFIAFINDACIVRPDVEVDATEIASSFRIWNKAKPSRNIFERFNAHLRTRFLARRIQNNKSNSNSNSNSNPNSNKNTQTHGFVGVMLKPMRYTKRLINDTTENFIFENCNFSPNNRLATSKLNKEFLEYKNCLGLEITNEELTELKKYLNSCSYVIKGTVRLHNEDESYEGYYGIALKSESENIRIGKSTTNKRVNKIDKVSGSIINSWDSIVKAATHENISASKMSRSCKNKIIYDDSYYYIVDTKT